MGVSASRQDSKVHDASTTSTNKDTDATFNSEQGKKTLNYLTDTTTNGNGQRYLDQSADAYAKQASGQVNPFVEDVIKSSNYEADKTFNNRLAQLRAQGYRGGTAANINGQGKYASDFSAQQEGQNANLRYGAFNDAQGRSIQGAAGLAGLGQGQQGLAAQLLALLRGESTDGLSHTDSTQSRMGHGVTGSYGVAGGSQA